MPLQEGQFVRHKETGRIGLVSKRASPPWDVYIVVRFPDGSGGYHLESDFERTKFIPKFVLKLTQKMRQYHG